jgi:pyridoxine 5'-phosphate synthase PdxJ
VAQAEEKRQRVSRCFAIRMHRKRRSRRRKATGADRIELYTGPYGSCHDDSEKAAKELERLEEDRR